MTLNISNIYKIGSSVKKIKLQLIKIKREKKIDKTKNLKPFIKSIKALIAQALKDFIIFVN